MGEGIKVILYFTSTNYRRHHWACKHLAEYRTKPHWLMDRRWARIMKRMWGKQIMSTILARELPDLKIGDVIHIPKIEG